ncbi:hypothetical protein GCM10008111_30510 [Alishewanella tabrizica]|uniref:Uncharacterized protein n=1 Tax=Alishewanella tabrizica TaxID=671278 RepID=A0ABQ2WUM5_9ALTE|nr:hypothetical protein [Alishewanella tabrizica]GGW72312.1 hypothetical protein GCM10008111_30510 [Alishewanella tabrizica]
MEHEACDAIAAIHHKMDRAARCQLATVHAWLICGKKYPLNYDQNVNAVTKRNAMSYTVEILQNNLLPLPEPLCTALGFAVGDILVCEMNKERNEMRMVKHTDQTLSDEAIEAASNLTRVISLSADE